MSWLRLIGLSCTRTEEPEDEIVVRVTWDWHPRSNATAEVLHARTMDVGDSVTLTNLTEFEHAAVVTVWESDRTSPDDFIGMVMVTPEFDGTGEHTYTVERSGLGSYHLSFEVTRARPEPAAATLRLLSLRCEDAQEAEDEPVIMVNGREVWSGRMRTHDTRTLDITSELRSEARIELWERDSARSDALGSHTVGLSLRGGGPQEHRFSRDRGIVGDASYRLRYQVE